MWGQSVPVAATCCACLADRRERRGILRRPGFAAIKLAMRPVTKEEARELLRNEIFREILETFHMVKIKGIETKPPTPKEGREQ